MNTPLLKILVVDDLAPEDIAMVQALYSRDPRSVQEHLKKVAEVGSGKFMATFYVGYGHKSIGDCGTTTIFIEGCSILAAKAIQDWLLYSGQEASTRYLPFDKQPIYSPFPDGVSLLQQAWLELYKKARREVQETLLATYPCLGVDHKIHEKAIAARTFDICRSLLPAGMTTMVSWHTNLRQAADHLKWMFTHPLTEVQGIARSIWDGLHEKYPSSIPQSPGLTIDELGYGHLSQSILATQATFRSGVSHREGVEGECHLLNHQVARFEPILEQRPRKAELPFQLRCCGDMTFRFLMDYGSYRDLQRQRSMIAIQPLLTTNCGFHPWYLEHLPEMIRPEISMLATQVTELGGTTTEQQYFIPLGFQVPIEMVATLPAAVYISELRSGKTVHPTVRIVAQGIATHLRTWLPKMALYADMDVDQFSLRRGTQDIVTKDIK